MIHIMFISMKQEMKNAKIQMKQLNLMLEENQAFMYSIWKKRRISKQEKDFDYKNVTNYKDITINKYQCSFMQKTKRLIMFITKQVI